MHTIKANLNDWGKRLLKKDEVSVSVSEINKDIKDIIFAEYPKDLVDVDSIRLDEPLNFKTGDVVKIVIRFKDNDTITVKSHVIDSSDGVVSVYKSRAIESVLKDNILHKDAYRRWVNDSESLLFNTADRTDCSRVKTLKWVISPVTSQEAEEYWKNEEFEKMTTTLLRMSTEMLMDFSYRTDEQKNYVAWNFFDWLFETEEWRTMKEKVSEIINNDTSLSEYFALMQTEVMHMTDEEYSDRITQEL